MSGAEARLEVRNARILVLPELAAAYFEVSNRGRADDRLLRIESSIAEIIQMHETVEENGVMRMRPSPEGFSVKAGETLRLEPGGKHLMLLNPLLSENSRPILRLHFEASGVIEVGAEVLTSPGGF